MKKNYVILFFFLISSVLLGLVIVIFLSFGLNYKIYDDTGLGIETIDESDLYVEEPPEINEVKPPPPPPPAPEFMEIVEDEQEVKSAKEYYLKGYDKFKNEDYEGAINDFSSYIKIMNDADKEGDNTWDLLTAVYGKEGVANAYYNRGNAKSFLNLFEEAIEDYTESIKLLESGGRIVRNNSLTDAYINRGISYNDIKDFNAAINDFTKTIKLNPDIPQAYHGRSVSKYYLGDLEGACEDAKQAQKLGYHASLLTKLACN